MEQIKHIRHDGYVISNVDGYNTIYVAEPDGRKTSKVREIRFAVGTAGHQKIKDDAVPKLMTIIYDDNGEPIDFEPIDTSTPPMRWNKEGWLKNNVPRYLYNNATIPSAAESLGRPREEVAEYYMKTMVAASIKAVHDLYGKVRVFDNGHHIFILHPEEAKIIGYERVGYSDWKCAPDLEELKEVPFWARKP